VANIDFKQSMKNEINNTVNHMNNYFNLITSPEKYDDRVFYLSTTSRDIIDEINKLFPENRKNIRSVILDKMVGYLKKQKKLSEFNIFYAPTSDNYEVFIAMKDEVWMTVSFYDRVVDVIKPDNIVEIEKIKIPNLNREIAKLKDAMDIEYKNLQEENIHDVKDYAMKMFFPKKYEENINKNMNVYLVNIQYKEKEIADLEDELNLYYSGMVWRERSIIEGEVSSLLQVRGE